MYIRIWYTYVRRKRDRENVDFKFGGYILINRLSFEI